MLLQLQDAMSVMTSVEDVSAPPLGPHLEDIKAATAAPSSVHLTPSMDGDWQVPLLAPLVIDSNQMLREQVSKRVDHRRAGTDSDGVNGALESL
jgi:hypothetical protein